MSVRSFIILFMLLGALLIPGGLAAQSDQGDETPPPPRWIVRVWDVGTTDAAAFVETHLAPEGIAVSTIAHRRNTEQRWATWRPGVPAFVNDFIALERGEVYWFAVRTETPEVVITPATIPDPAAAGSAHFAAESHSGTGNQRFSVRLQAGLVVFDLAHGGYGRFEVDLNDDLLGTGRGVVSEFGVWHARYTGIHDIRVRATGDWRMILRQPRDGEPIVVQDAGAGCVGADDHVDVDWEPHTPVPSWNAERLVAHSFTCEHAALTPPFDLELGYAEVLFTHEGDGPFSVTLVRSNGEPAFDSAWVREVGPAMEAMTPVHVRREWTYRLLVEATAPWSVTVLQIR